MKTIMITGAGGNLGMTVTKKLLESGHQVVATVMDESAKKELGLHKNLQTEIVNLTNEAETASFAQRILDKYAKVDAAMMLVGGFTAGNISSANMEDIKKQMALNFDTAFNLTRPIFRHMMENGDGRLIYIGARPVLDPDAGKELLAYALAKSLIFKLAEFLNAEAKGKNVSATVIVPSTIDTPVNRKNMPDSDPGKWVKPEQLADVLEFVISEQGSALRETVLKVYHNS